MSRQLADRVVDVLEKQELYRLIRAEARETIVNSYDLRRVCPPEIIRVIEKACGTPSGLSLADIHPLQTLERRVTGGGEQPSGLSSGIKNQAGGCMCDGGGRDDEWRDTESSHAERERKSPQLLPQGKSRGAGRPRIRGKRRKTELTDRSPGQ